MIPVVRTDNLPIVGGQTPGITAADRDLHRHLNPGRTGQRKASSGTGRGSWMSAPIPLLPSHASGSGSIPLTARKRSRLRCYTGSHGRLRLNPSDEGVNDAGNPGIRSRGISPLPRLLTGSFQFSRFKARLMALGRGLPLYPAKGPDFPQRPPDGLGGASSDAICRRTAEAYPLPAFRNIA
jgi:hypothetical protein